MLIIRVLANCLSRESITSFAFLFELPLAQNTVFIARVVFSELYMTARSTEKVFGEEGYGVEWTVVRIGHLWWR
jgi:hypothetical protein